MEILRSHIAKEVLCLLRSDPDSCLEPHIIAPLKLPLMQAIALQLSAGSQLGLHAVAALATIVAGCQVDKKQIETANKSLLFEFIN